MAELTEATKSMLVEVSHKLAVVARNQALASFRMSGLLSENKLADGFDPVTKADRDAEAAMREILARERPDDGVIGEEFPPLEGSSGLTWVLDPIDGTRGYISGTPTWGVLIAVGDETGPLLGVIDQPYVGERFIGGFGLAEYEGPLGLRPLKTRAAQPLSQATLLTTFPEVGTAEEGRAFHAVSRQAQLTRYGMDCYGYALLAAGCVDLVIEAELNAYDIQAPIAVVQAAGGIVTDWAGNPAHNGGRAIAAANPEIHAEAMAILREVTG